MSPELAEIVEQAYELFAPYQVSKPLDVCMSCCVTREEEHQLATLQLREIPHALLYAWNRSAITQQPDQNELKYFLPRILDFIARYQWLPAEPARTFKRFPNEPDGQWAAAELELLHRFGYAFFRDSVNSQNAIRHANPLDIVEMFMPTGIDVCKLFSTWQQSHTTSAVGALAELATSRQFKAVKPAYNVAFSSTELNERVAGWLCNEGVLRELAGKLEHVILQDDSLDDRAYAELNASYETIQLLLPG